jgi:hypothetical protein
MELVERSTLLSTETMRLRGRPVTHEEARAAVQRLVNSRFNNPDPARVSIPVQPDDDDIVATDYVLEQSAKDAAAEADAKAMSTVLQNTGLFNSLEGGAAGSGGFWELSRITNEHHAAEPYGQGYAVTLAAGERRVWEKAADIPGAVVKALGRWKEGR